MNSLEEFMAALEKGLADMPKETADDVIEYFSEYIDDAKSAGLSDDTILMRMGKAENIIASTKDELAIAKAQSSPGPLNLFRSSKRMLGRGAARAAKSTSLGLLSILPLLSALVFYAASAAFGLAAPASAAFIVHSMLIHPGLAAADIWAQTGLILSLFTACGAIAWGLWKAANGLTRVTLNIYRTMVSRARSMAVKIRKLPKRKKWGELILGIALAALLAAGINLTFMGELIPRYWALWNSQKPADTTMVSKEFPAGDVLKISITTLNTSIEIIDGSDEDIKIAYEKTPYFEFGAKLDTGHLDIIETDNGMLPLVDLLSAHEGTTRMTISVPRDMRIKLAVKTNGGNVEVLSRFSSVEIATHSGNITLHTADGTYAGKAESETGKVTIIKE
jgi:uncharacterized membrane protein